MKADGRATGGEDPSATAEKRPPTEDPPPETVLKPALRLLSTRPRSIREMRERLLKKGLEASAVSHCLRWLEDRDLLNDETFARALTRDRLRFSPRSPFSLQRELKNRGVRAPLAETVVEAVIQEEETSPAELAARAARDWVRRQTVSARAALAKDRFTPEREKMRRRLYGFLSRRGFVGEVAKAGLEAGEEGARAFLEEEEARESSK